MTAAKEWQLCTVHNLLGFLLLSKLLHILRHNNADLLLELGLVPQLEEYLHQHKQRSHNDSLKQVVEQGRGTLLMDPVAY